MGFRGITWHGFPWQKRHNFSQNFYGTKIGGREKIVQYDLHEKCYKQIRLLGPKKSRGNGKAKSEKLASGKSSWLTLFIGNAGLLFSMAFSFAVAKHTVTKKNTPPSNNKKGQTKKKHKKIWTNRMSVNFGACTANDNGAPTALFPGPPLLPHSLSCPAPLYKVPFPIWPSKPACLATKLPMGFASKCFQKYSKKSFPLKVVKCPCPGTGPGRWLLKILNVPWTKKKNKNKREPTTMLLASKYFRNYFCMQSEDFSNFHLSKRTRPICKKKK